MATVHRLSRQDARRVAVRAQMLTGQRPPDLLTLVRRLTILQLDPVSAVAPSADLVAWSRLGAAYHPDDLKAAVASQSVIELRAFLRPAEDIAAYRAEMAACPGSGELRDWQVSTREWVAANDKCRLDILARLAAGGPPPSRGLPDRREKARQAPGLDKQQERHQAPRIHGVARRGRGRRPQGKGAALGPGRAGLPRPPGPPAGG